MSNRICIVCGVDISNQHHNSKMCPLCSAKKIGNLDAIVKIDPSYLNDMEENIHYVKCSYCGYVGRTLQYHLKSEHNMTSKEYETITGCLAMCSEEKAIRSKKFSGENNPGWKHGGKLSPWSYNSNKTKEEVDRCREKTIQSIQTTNKLNTKLDYWLKQTNGDVNEAKKLLSERQTTFTLKKCIDRYGDEEGQLIWKHRQDKWIDTMNSKSDDEKLLINTKKLYKGGSISKAEEELANALSEHFDIVKQLVIKYDNTHNFLYDISYKNKIIEFNGDFWHCSPQKYNSGDYIHLPSKTILVDEIWKKDEEKINFAKQQGYEVLVIWESEYKKNKENVIQQCITFFGSDNEKV